jgi:N-acetylneuraminic acid mutarotase
MIPSAILAPTGNAGENPRGRVRHQVPLVRGVRRVLFLLLATGGGSLAAPASAAGQEAWTPTSTTGAPFARGHHTAVWTGSRMIVWGGFGQVDLNSGGMYNPTTDTWTATSMTGAPTPRSSHPAVWTGSKMIVWGGLPGGVNTGGIYDPAADTWRATSTTNAPTARWAHTAVWTGSKMIVWGGIDGGSNYLRDGGIYDPATNTWTATSTVGAPSVRGYHTAVWTGSKMIVWGGIAVDWYHNDGGMYDPATDTWTATSVAPLEGRWYHTAVWTGSKMIVWGGGTPNFVPTRFRNGGIYDPTTNTWTTTSTTNPPEARERHTAVWTGSRMIVWGANGYRTGGIYDPVTDTWTATSLTNAPTGRDWHTAVWTGSKMIVWGGYGSGFVNTGGVYSNPAVLPPPPPPTDFNTVTPCRVFDTRELGGPTLGAPLTCGTEWAFTVAGECGVPSSAKAVSLNLTGTKSTAQGNLRLFASGTPTPLVSSLNYVAGQTRANNAVIPLGTGGQISVLCSPSGTTHVVLDVHGYFQ